MDLFSSKLEFDVNGIDPRRLDGIRTACPAVVHGV